MEVLALILIIAGVVAWVVLPLGTPRPEELSAAANPLPLLEARRQELLLALQDLDFELQTGKLSPGDHASLRDRLQAEAVDVLRTIEEASNASS